MSETSPAPPPPSDTVPPPEPDPTTSSESSIESSTTESSIESSTQESTTSTTEESTTSTTEQSTTSTTEESSTSTTPESSTESSTSTTTTEESTTSTTSSEETTSTTSESSTTEQTTFETTVTSTGDRTTETTVVTVTNTRTQNAPSDTTATQTSGTATPIDPSSGGGGGLPEGGKVAIGVVVPIVAIAILAIVGLFFWKKRKARLAAEEERRKEVEDYSYNPNADPSYPAVGGGGGVMGGDAGYEMREDASSGYRGWGTTLAGSTGRKASTTMSGGGLGGAYSDATSPTQPHASLSRADEVHSPEGEILGAMGPSATNNRGTGVNRGPSNASSSYSAAGRSEGSDGAIGGYGGGATYYDQQAGAGGNPYSDNPYGPPQEMPGQPVIRDNPARRNTRIENPSHYPQQSAGISQNF